MKRLLIILALVIAPVAAYAETFNGLATETDFSKFYDAVGRPDCLIGVNGVCQIAYDPSSQTSDIVKKQDRLAQIVTTPGVTVTPAPDSRTKLTVDAGGIATSVLEWFYLAFAGSVSAAIVAGVLRFLTWIGIKTTMAQKAELQAIVVNGINTGYNKAKTELNNLSPVQVKDASLAYALAYTQEHGAALIQAMGLKPGESEAISAINARIQTALNDPATPTPPAISPQPPKVAGVVVEGTKV